MKLLADALRKLADDVDNWEIDPADYKATIDKLNNDEIPLGNLLEDFINKLTNL